MAKTFYVTKQQLEDEIILSKKIFKESNYPRTPAECFTPNLTKYLVLLVDRYANKSQWRGYCVCSETEALTQRGWLKIDDITENDVILSYDKDILKWSKIKSIFRSEYNGKMFKMTGEGIDALVTPGHKFVTDDGLKKMEELHKEDKIILMPKTMKEFIEIPSRNQILVKDINFHGAAISPNIDYKGRVWCPETEYGCFVARRNGTVYLTGNSYILDMKSDALTTLCQNCFKYDETRFNNPFGYLTQIVKYCFITFLEKEELMRDIKDSLWESIGMAPSYTRQIKNEMLRDVVDQSSKGMKELKKDTDIINVKIDLLSEIIFKMRNLHTPDIDLDLKISEILEIEPLAFTADIEAVISLFANPPHYKIESDIQVADQTVNCITLFDAATKSNTKHIIPNIEDYTIVSALCFLALTIKRDMLVKKVREISGYNITSTRIPAADKMIVADNYEIADTTYTEYTPTKRRPPRKD